MLAPRVLEGFAVVFLRRDTQVCLVFCFVLFLLPLLHVSPPQAVPVLGFPPYASEMLQKVLLGVQMPTSEPEARPQAPALRADSWVTTAQTKAAFPSRAGRSLFWGGGAALQGLQGCSGATLHTARRWSGGGWRTGCTALGGHKGTEAKAEPPAGTTPPQRRANEGTSPAASMLEEMQL